MLRRIAWFEREFTFNLPVGMYPNVLERLRGTPARLADRLGSLPREILTARDAGRWSMQEHAGHLLDLGSLDLARLADFEAGHEMLQAADLKNRKTHEANHNAQPIESVLDAFGSERAQFLRRLDGYDEALVERIAIHPRLNAPMRVIDFAFFIAEHDDHHMAAITELMRGSVA